MGKILKAKAVEFFSRLYADEGEATRQWQLSGHIPTLTMEEVEALAAQVTKDEVQNAVFQMSPLKAPGMDGIQALFFQKHWSVVGESLFLAIKDIFDGGSIDEAVCKTLIVLIPKKDKPENFSQFRPISLCNTFYKIITKIIANRFKVIMNKVVAPMQSSFVPGRQITDNIIITQEVVHSMRTRKGRVGFMAVKVDLEKAYDRLGWDFIADTLKDVGIPGRLSSVIMKCLTGTTMQICWNGEVSEAFRPARGVRQGDPLSPYIFVLCMERLSHLITQEVRLGHWQAINLGKKSPPLSHLFFADDLVLFCKASVEQVLVIEKVLNYFCECSGQRLSKEKSVVFFSRNVNGNTAETIG